MKKIVSHSAEELQKIGQRLAKQLRGGDVLALTGPLGAGKTTLTKGIAAGLGIKQIVNSPTFLLMKTYPIPGKNMSLIHVDCYRIGKAAELTDIGLTELLGRADTITVIEWPEKIKKLLPRQKKLITIELQQNDSRIITFL
ncbi:MAG: tRNA (adenosine(37)-N6)-threonylcarbamoyltransferase complex ATPase subunit type 1 TsaE [Candidatus Buchananbacteria bacterium RIFCSPHIGHO2_01_FULL_47_11b]|uniref:tRNA threonylcarbamoyladenosine biosynthesis protein TsaE n=1 Tax=Candidatus Buchananbacteria bacterium RIFCSPHIGHO2_01_FULL_47_11b TaxID=1797537 RepID=A0A1G1Y332_9BACT|nr:MAG: tRNA (adenosine(37)-N6)-threonylcarbamoyltransferase complex ATPase subunit type 1 TsaE [Candidatus Buchananbacteria bacterium RIFCSPHIGHO2_01_FULL_47_11b]